MNTAIYLEWMKGWVKGFLALTQRSFLGVENKHHASTSALYGFTTAILHDFKALFLS